MRLYTFTYQLHRNTLFTRSPARSQLMNLADNDGDMTE